MQLKKDETPKTDTLKLNDDGFFNTEQLKSQDDNFVSRISEEYSRTGNNTNYAGTVDYEYDEKTERNAFRLTEDDVKKAFAPTVKEQREQKDRIIIISEIILYIVLGIFLFFISKCCIADKIDIYFSLKQNIPLIAFLIIYFIIDAIFVIAMGNKKGGLLVMALLFPFYPFYRKKVLNDSNFGIIPTLLILFSAVMIFLTIGNVKNSYDNVMFWEDKTTRHYMAELMDQQLTNNKRLGTMMISRFDMSSYEVSVQGNNAKIVIEAKGNIKVDDINTNDAKVFNTLLTFERDNPDKDFELSEVTLDDKNLSENQILQFWTKLETDSR